MITVKCWNNTSSNEPPAMESSQVNGGIATNLYEDNAFPPADSSIFQNPNDSVLLDKLRTFEPGVVPCQKGIIWLRPHEYVKRIELKAASQPKLQRPISLIARHNDNTTPNALSTGAFEASNIVLYPRDRPPATAAENLLSISSFISVLCGLGAAQPLFLQRLVLNPEEWLSTGRFIAQFYNSGNWTVVEIDSRLPCAAATVKERPVKSVKEHRSEGCLSQSASRHSIQLSEKHQTRVNTSSGGNSEVATKRESSKLLGEDRLNREERQFDPDKCTAEAMAATPVQHAFCCTFSPEEMWVPLFEKAYAKYLGNYEQISRRTVGDILVDLTGGIVEPILICNWNSDTLWAKMKKHFVAGVSLMICAFIENDEETVYSSIFTDSSFAARMKNNLLLSRYYTVIDVVRVGAVRLVRLNNPWRLPTWRGEFSDYHRSWVKHNDLRDRLDYKFGEAVSTFWMTWDDFFYNFTHVNICQVLPLLEDPLIDVRHGMPNAEPISILAVVYGIGYPDFPKFADGSLCLLDESRVYGYKAQGSWKEFQLCGQPKFWLKQMDASVTNTNIGGETFTDIPVVEAIKRSSTNVRTMKVQFSHLMNYAAAASMDAANTAAAALTALEACESVEAAGEPAEDFGNDSPLVDVSLAAAIDATAATTTADAWKHAANFGKQLQDLGHPVARLSAMTRGSTACSRRTQSKRTTMLQNEEDDDDFDTSWINAPMFVVTLPVQKVPSGSSLCKGQQTSDSINLIFSLIQEYTGDINTPMSIALFHLKGPQRFWDCRKVELIGVSQYPHGSSVSTKSNTGAIYTQKNKSVIVSTPNPINEDRQTFIRVRLPKKYLIKATDHSNPFIRHLGVVCYQNLPPWSSKLKEKNFCLRVFSDSPVKLESLRPPERAEFRGRWSLKTAGGKAFIEEKNGQEIFSPRWALNPQFFLYADPKFEQTEICILLQRSGYTGGNGGAKIGLILARLLSLKDFSDIKNLEREQLDRDLLKRYKNMVFYFDRASFHEQQHTHQKRKLVIERDEWFAESNFSSPDRASLHLTISPFTGPLVIAPCFESAGLVGEFILHVFSNNPLQTVRMLEEYENRSFLGFWDSDTAGGSHVISSLDGVDISSFHNIESRNEIEEDLSWNDNPRLHISVRNNTRVALTLARHDDCWAKQKEQDVVGCMIGIYLLRGQEINLDNLVTHTEFTPENEVSLTVELSTDEEENADYIFVPATYRPGCIGDFLLSLSGDLREVEADLILE